MSLSIALCLQLSPCHLAERYWLLPGLVGSSGVTVLGHASFLEPSVVRQLVLLTVSFVHISLLVSFYGPELILSDLVTPFLFTSWPRQLRRQLPTEPVCHSSPNNFKLIYIHHTGV